MDEYDDEALAKKVASSAIHSDPPFADLAVKIDMSRLVGWRKNILGGIAMGATIALEQFSTQFVLDIAAALSVSFDRVYVLNVSRTWSEKTTVRWRLLNDSSFSVESAVQQLTRQAQRPSSPLFRGNVTKALDSEWGVVALDWDLSLRLAYALDVVGEKIPGEWCEDDHDTEYCEWENYFEEDIARALEIRRDRVEILFVRAASPDSVLTHFRIFPDDDVSSAVSVGRLMWQVKNLSSPLYDGNVTVKTDPAWGVSGVNASPRRESSRHLPYAARSNSSLPFLGYASHSISPGYERCKVTQRCARGYVHYDQSNATVYYTTQAFAGGKHLDATFFASFEDWRAGTYGWGPDGKSRWLQSIDSMQSRIRGAHVSPFDFSRLGPRVRTIDPFGWCHERQPCQPIFNSGLVLNAVQQDADVDMQRALVENVASDLAWVLEEKETALLDADGARSRADSSRLMLHRASDVRAKLDDEFLVLNRLSSSQCSGVQNCMLLFNTSSLELNGAINVTGEISTSEAGHELAVFAFDSIALGPEVSVTVVGQRALVLASRTSIFLNTSIKANPGTLGGFPGGFSVARKPEDDLSDESDDLPLDDLSSFNYTSNNINGPGSPSSRVHLRTLTTEAANIDEVQLVEVFAIGGDGETMMGTFKLGSGDKMTRALSPFVSPAALEHAIEHDLNRHLHALNDPPGVGRVSVSRGRPADVGIEDSRNAWLITFSTATEMVPLLTFESSSDAQTYGRVSRIKEGNSIGGFFSLAWNSERTRILPHDATAAEVATALVSDLSDVTTASVSRSNTRRRSACDDGLCESGPDTAGGLTWALTLTTLADNVSPVAPTDRLRTHLVAPIPVLRAVAHNLTGINATVSVEEGHATVRHRDHLARVSSSSFSLAYGGSGAGYGGQGGGPAVVAGLGAGYVASSSKRSAYTNRTYRYFNTGGHDVEIPGAINTTGGWGQVYGDESVRELVGGSGGAIGYSHPFVIATLESGDKLPGRGGAGGGAIEIVAVNDVEFGALARLSVDGESGHAAHTSGGGGGSGGSVVVVAGGSLMLASQSAISAKGGNGGDAINPGSGGGGGRVALYGTVFAQEYLPDIDVSGGLSDGGNGSVYVDVDSINIRYDFVSGGAFGTPRALRVTASSGIDTASETSSLFSGPSFRFPSVTKPSRVSFFIKAERTDTSSWGGLLAFFDSKKRTEMGLGVVVSNSKLTHGSGFRVLPDEIVATAEEGRWHKIDVSLDWAKSSYDIFVDDVRQTYESPLKSAGFDSVGARVIAGEARFDEIYIGPDHTIGFRCPQSTRSGPKMVRPLRKAWSPSDLGEEGVRTARMMRHHNHVSERESYQHDHGGLVPYDGWGHIDFRSDVKQRYASGDLPEKSASINAGSLLALSHGVVAEGPSRRQAQLATTSVGLGLHHHMDEEWEDDSHNYQAYQDGKHDEKSGSSTYVWFGEHEISTDSPPWLTGGIGACSTDDLVHWKREGIVLHFANITDMVHRRDAWLPGCDGYETKYGTGAGYGCAGSSGLKAIRPRVLISPTGGSTSHGFIMWMGIDDINGSLALAGVATAAHASGPYTFRRSFYPDGNETRDQAVWRRQRSAKQQAFLGRTYFTNIEYVMPSPQMQPIWEMVMDETGQVDFGLSYHRAFYLRDYDDYHDIYLQRWRLEDKPWLVLCVDRRNHLNNFSVPRGSSAGEEGAACPDPWYFKLILGQGYDVDRKEAVGVESRFKDPMNANNSKWRPDSVPAVKAQPWKNNYIDGTCGEYTHSEDLNDPDLANRQIQDRSNCSNIADNPPHETRPDDLVGQLRRVETRRTKFFAISQLTDDFLDTTTAVHTYEGELENGLEVDSLFEDSHFFDGDDNFDVATSTFEPSVIAGDYFPGEFVPDQDSVARYHQYIERFNDRAQYSLNCVYDGTCPVNFKDQVV